MLTKEACRRGGQKAGRKAIESGLLAKLAILGSPIGHHVRWHVNRGIENPAKCKLCRAASEHSTW
jgi:hypothetical protein